VYVVGIVRAFTTAAGCAAPAALIGGAAMLVFPGWAVGAAAIAGRSAKDAPFFILKMFVKFVRAIRAHAVI
jgi:hypothetical protein